MPVLLDSNSYGKSRVRLVKVTRREDRHDLRNSPSTYGSRAISTRSIRRATIAMS